MGYAVITQQIDENDFLVQFPGQSKQYNAFCVTKDPLTADSIVETVDVNNLCPPAAGAFDSSGIRLLPNVGEYQYGPWGKKKWYPIEFMKQNEASAISILFYLFSCMQNPSWQVNQPIYRIATVDSVINSTDLRVTYRGGQHTPTYPFQKVLKAQYMLCNAEGFQEGDEVVVRAIPRKGDAVVVGFWNRPVPCGNKTILVSLGNDGIGYDFFVWDVGRREYAKEPSISDTRTGLFQNWQRSEHFNELFAWDGRIGIKESDFTVALTCGHPYGTACAGCDESYSHSFTHPGDGVVRYATHSNTITWEEGCDEGTFYPTGVVNQVEQRVLPTAQEYIQTLMGSFAPYYKYTGLLTVQSLFRSGYTIQETTEAECNEIGYTDGSWARTRTDTFITPIGQETMQTDIQSERLGYPEKMLYHPFYGNYDHTGVAFYVPYDQDNTAPRSEFFPIAKVSEDDGMWLQIYAWEVISRHWYEAYENIDNADSLIIATYDKMIESAADLTGQVTCPIAGGSIYLNAFDGGKSGVVMDTQQKAAGDSYSQYHAETTNGRVLEVEIDANGNYELKGVPVQFPVCLVYWYICLYADWDQSYVSNGPLMTYHGFDHDTGARSVYSHSFSRGNLCIAKAELTAFSDDPQLPNESGRDSLLEAAIENLMDLAAIRQLSDGTITEEDSVGGRMEVFLVRSSLSSSSTSRSLSSSSSSKSSSSSSSESQVSQSFSSSSKSSSSSSSSSSYSSSSSSSSSYSSMCSSSSSYAGDREAITQEFQEIINNHRSLVGVHPLRFNPELTLAARRHAEDMATNEFLGHQGTDGSWPEDRIKDCFFLDTAVSGYSTGENVCSGAGAVADSPQKAFDIWYDSPPHYQGMIDKDMFEFGLWWTINNSTGVIYWCLTMGKNIYHKVTKET